MKKQKKTFKETKVGAFLTERAPQVVSQVGEFLPDKGALGIVKNIISSDNTIETKDICRAPAGALQISWVELLKTLLITVYVAYFGSRGAEKVFINKN